MKFWTLEEILEEKLKNPEFKAAFEAEKKVLAAERAAEERTRTIRNVFSRPRTKQRSHRPTAVRHAVEA